MRCVYGVWDHLKNSGDHGAEDYDLQWVGMLPGIRESRRLMGDYILTENDVLANRIFPDAVAYGGWPIDNHTPGGLDDKDVMPSTVRHFPGLYTIPYRCYCSRDRVERALISMGVEELEDLLAKQGGCELGCQFCDKVYRYSAEELRSLIDRLKAQKEADRA